MATRIEELVERQRAFAGDASHQIRTPLTALRLRLEQIGARLDDDAAADDLEAAMLETERLHRIVEGLLALSRADDAAGALVVVDVGQVAIARVDSWRPLAVEQGVTIDYLGPDSARASAVEGAVGQVVDNLVANAPRRVVGGRTPSRSGSVMSTTWSSYASSTRVRGCRRPNASGPSIGSGVRRKRRRVGRGSGLAIVRQLVRAGDGTCELREAPGGGLDVVVRLRRATVRPT